MYRALLSTAANRHIIVRPVRGSVRHYSSPFKVFMDTLKEQIKKDKDIKTLQDESGRLTESDALKKAKEMLEKAKVCLIIHQKTKCWHICIRHSNLLSLND